jgi:hypothetical protein
MAHNSLTNRADNLYESTLLDPPETPAHQFAVKAFKHAIFGTPAPDDAKNASGKDETKAKIAAANAKMIDLPAPKEDVPLLSPSKQPGGILMTPGTASKGRKTVSFGSHVVDNEGKRGNAGKSGIPNDCPGKFPSPFMPGTGLKLEPGSDKRPRTKLTEALLDARTTTQPKSGQKPKARDDSDITIDLGAPRSESGKYWKEQYESYAERSEREMKKVIGKQQLAKHFAMKKDGEVTELATKLEQERKRFRQRERELEQQNKDYQERLRQAMADNMSSSIETAALKARVAVLERAKITTIEAQQAKEEFHIYEDASKGIERFEPEQDRRVQMFFAPSLSMASSGKENSSPKARRQRHQTLLDARPSHPSRLGAGEDEVSIILGKSPRGPMQPSATTTQSAIAFLPSEQIARSPLKPRKTEHLKEGTTPTSPAVVLPSSPLPMPSPEIDPWMELNQDNSISQVDRMAMPNYAGQPFSRPEWNPPPRQHRVSKSVSHVKHTDTSRSYRRAEKPAVADEQADIRRTQDRPTEKATDKLEARLEALRPTVNKNLESEKPEAETTRKPGPVANLSPTDPKFDLSKITAHHAEGSAQVKKDRAEILPAERKELARKRIEERRRLKKNAPS